MVVHYPRTVWKICYAEHKETGKTYTKNIFIDISLVIGHDLSPPPNPVFLGFNLAVPSHPPPPPHLKVTGFGHFLTWGHRRPLLGKQGTRANLWSDQGRVCVSLIRGSVAQWCHPVSVEVTNLHILMGDPCCNGLSSPIRGFPEQRPLQGKVCNEIS